MNEREVGKDPRLAMGYQGNPVDIIRGEIKLNITSLVKVLAAQWDNVKNQRMGTDDELYNMLVVGYAHDLIMDMDDRPPIKQVYVVADNLYAQLSLLKEPVTELGGHKVWANCRDGAETVTFFERLYADRAEDTWGKAIGETMERHKSLLGETDAERAARDKWEQNSN